MAASYYGIAIKHYTFGSHKVVIVAVFHRHSIESALRMSSLFSEEVCLIQFSDSLATVVNGRQETELMIRRDARKRRDCRSPLEIALKSGVRQVLRRVDM